MRIAAFLLFLNRIITILQTFLIFHFILHYKTVEFKDTTNQIAFLRVKMFQL